MSGTMAARVLNYPAAQFFDNALYSDITIKFGDRSVKAHRAILHMNSPWFVNALSHNFKGANEPVTTLKEPDLNHDAIYAMLEFIYKRTYIVPSHIQGFAAILEFHVKVYHASKYYFVDAACSHALNNFQMLARFDPDKMFPDDFDAYAAAARAIYKFASACDGDEMRKVFVNLSVRIRGNFLAKRHVQNQELLDEVPELATDMTLMLVQLGVSEDWIPGVSATQQQQQQQLMGTSGHSNPFGPMPLVASYGYGYAPTATGSSRNPTFSYHSDDEDLDASG